MPDGRVEGPPRLLYDSVRGGPHRPFVSGGGENGCNASIVHVVYESRQMYPAYVIEVEMEMGAEMVAAVRNNSTEGSASAGPAPKRQRHAAPSGGGGGGGGSSHSATHVPASAPPSDAEVRAMGVAAAVAALRAHASVSRVALVACGRLAELCLEAQNRQPAAGYGRDVTRLVYWLEPSRRARRTTPGQLTGGPHPVSVTSNRESGVAVSSRT